MQTLSDHILDIAQNSIRAQASRVEIDLQENITEDSLVITIRDNGCGMDETTVAKVTDPFFTSRTVRKVGLGIPLFKQNAEINFIYRHTTEKGEYTFDTNEVKEILEGVPLNDPEIVMALRQMIRENIKEITQTS